MGVCVSVVAIVAQLETIIAPSDYEISVWPGMVFNPSTTVIDVYPDDPWRGEGAGMGDIGGAYQFLVRARTGLNDLDSGQLILLDLMDDDSDVCVSHALGDDNTLNGLAAFIDVGDPSGFRPYLAPGETTTLVGVQWPVSVLAAHS